MQHCNVSFFQSQTCFGGEAAHQGSCHVDAGCSRVCAVHPRGLWEAEEAIRVLHVELGGTYATGVLGVDECELCEAGVGVAPRGSTRLRLEVHKVAPTLWRLTFRVRSVGISSSPNRRHNFSKRSYFACTYQPLQLFANLTTHLSHSLPPKWLPRNPRPRAKAQKGNPAQPSPAPTNRNRNLQSLPAARPKESRSASRNPCRWLSLVARKRPRVWCLKTGRRKRGSIQRRNWISRP